MLEHVTVNGQYAVVPLTRGKFAKVDLSDMPRVSQYSWHTVGPMPSGQYYASNGQRMLMHRLIMRPASEQLVDHRENDGLDNRRSNLRVCDKAQNAGNGHARKRKSGLKGVHWNKGARKFCAQIRHRCKRYYLGLFQTEEAAARAYDAKARELWGDFANTNYQL